MPTEREFQKILFNLGIELGVSPKRILTRLLDDQNISNALVAGISISSLRVHIAVWRDNGFPDYRHGESLSK